LDLSKSSVHNYLATLEAAGYLVNRDGTYRLGLRFLTNGMAAKTAISAEQEIVTTIRSIAAEISQPTWWVVEEAGRGYFIEHAIPDEQSPTYGRVGKRSYLHTHALGKAILASSTDDYVERVADHHGLPDHTTQTTTDIDVVMDDLMEIRDRGFAISDGEMVLGILSVGVGFSGAAGRRHAVGVFGDSRSLAGTQAEAIGQRLVDTVGELERRLEEGP
jgi:DNA-binding IclR family transcriptional regulator